MPLDILFDFAAVHIDGEGAADADIRLDLVFTDRGETWTMWVRNGVLNARPGASSEPQATITGPKAALVGLLVQPKAAQALVDKGALQVAGDSSAIAAYAAVVDDFDPDFAIVTP